MSYRKINRTRKHAVIIYLNEVEYQTLYKKAGDCGMSANAYVRDIIHNVQPMAMPPVEYGEILRELHALGCNLNQIAAKAHSLGFIDEPKYRENVRELWNVCGDLSAVLVHREKLEDGSH